MCLLKSDCSHLKAQQYGDGAFQGFSTEQISIFIWTCKHCGIQMREFELWTHSRSHTTSSHTLWLDLLKEIFSENLTKSGMTVAEETAISSVNNSLYNISQSSRAHLRLKKKYYKVKECPVPSGKRHIESTNTEKEKGKREMEKEIRIIILKQKGWF